MTDGQTDRQTDREQHIVDGGRSALSSCPWLCPSTAHIRIYIHTGK